MKLLVSNYSLIVLTLCLVLIEEDIVISDHEGSTSSHICVSRQQHSLQQHWSKLLESTAGKLFSSLRCLHL